MIGRKSQNRLGNRPKRKAPKTAYKPGQSGNPGGRPKSGETWSDIFRQVGEQYPEEIVAVLGMNNALGQQIALLPKHVQIKYLMATRVVAQIMFEPSASLLSEMLNRIEGKVPDRSQSDQRLEVVGLKEMLEKVYGAGADSNH